MSYDEIDLETMLNELNKGLGIKSPLLEGGATMNGPFLKARLVDEVSLLMCPAIDGNTGSFAIFEAGEGGLKKKYRLELTSVTPGAHNTCHLRYRLRKDLTAASPSKPTAEKCIG